jgi:hypothetical protein
LSDDQTIPSGGDRTIPFVVHYDPQSWIKNAGTSSMRFQPSIPGYYLITLNGWWGAGSVSAQMNLQVRKNGNTHMILQSLINTTGKTAGD